MNSHEANINTIDVCRAVIEHMKDDLDTHFKDATDVVMLSRLSELIGKCNTILADVARNIDEAIKEGGEAKQHAVNVLNEMRDLLRPVISYAVTVVAVADENRDRN